MDVNGKRVLVVGLGKSGVSSALFLRKHGAQVTVSDSKPPDQLQSELTTLLDHGIAVETGRHGERTFRAQDLIVVSPGVPYDVQPLAQARLHGVPIIGEIELAAQFSRGRIIAVTGSNGKTTTTTLVGEILAEAGNSVLVGGNIGTPAISLAEKTTPHTLLVLEVSSFQLETIQTFHPFIAAILNITPDHLDRHRTFEAYVEAKTRIFENQTTEDFGVLNADDPASAGLSHRVHSKPALFSRKKELDRGAFVRGASIIFRDGQTESSALSVTEIPLKGLHNVENVLASVCIGMLAGASPESVRRAVRKFKAVEHRLEFVAKIRGVDYYNDSKATNVDATIKAAESFPANLHLILGGKDKGTDYSVLNDLLRQRVKRVYTIGAAAKKIESQIAGVSVTSAETLENAVRWASKAAVPGDIVLLAPACASFDQFDNYEHRGQVFKNLVHALQAEANS